MVEGWGVIPYALVGAVVGRFLDVCIERLPEEPAISTVLHRPLVVSLLTAILFGLLWLQFGPSVRMAAATLYIATLVVITFIDPEHRLILNSVIYPSILIGLPLALLYGNSILSTVIGGGVGFVSLFWLFLLARGGLGAGDVKLAALVGLFSGFPGVLTALLSQAYSQVLSQRSCCSPI